MLKKFSQIALVAFLFLNACSDETTVYVDDLQEDVVLETSETKLQSSISYDKSGVLDIWEEAGGTNKSARLNDEPAGDYPLSLVAQIKAPTYQGNSDLTASHVDIDGDYAFVSYNTAGEDYFGALEIINISDPANPSVTSRVFYLNADINALKYDAGFVYAVGGVDAEQSATATSNSLLAKIPVSGDRFDINAGITYGFQQGFNANDVNIKDGLVWVTSGKDGSLTTYNKSDLQIQNEVPFSDLRSLAFNGNNIALLDAGTGVKVLDENLNTIKEIPINTNFGDFSKKTVSFEGDKIMVSEANKGAGVYSYNSGSLIEYIPILLNPTSAEAGDIVTNAVVSNDKVVLMANGAAGLCLSEENTQGTDPFGIIQLEGSINYVASRGDYIFAASGREGLQIIKINRPSQSLESRCATLPSYQGSSKVIVPSGESAGYRGSKRLNNITVGGNLLLCGTWTVRNTVTIESGGLFEMNGTMVVGRNNRRRSITLDENSTMRVEGTMWIFGDVILNDGATLEFIGDSNTVVVFGDVIRNGNVTVSGNFRDVRNKF